MTSLQVKAQYKLGKLKELSEFKQLAAEFNAEATKTRKAVAIAREMFKTQFQIRPFRYDGEDELCDAAVAEVLEDVVNGAVKLAMLEYKYAIFEEVSELE